MPKRFEKAITAKLTLKTLKPLKTLIHKGQKAMSEPALTQKSCEDEVELEVVFPQNSKLTDDEKAAVHHIAELY